MVGRGDALVQSQPLFVAVGAAVVLDERVGRRRTAGIGVAAVGMVAISAGNLPALVLLAEAPGPTTLAGAAVVLLGIYLIFRPV